MDLMKLKKMQKKNLWVSKKLMKMKDHEKRQLRRNKSIHPIVIIQSMIRIAIGIQIQTKERKRKRRRKMRQRKKKVKTVRYRN